MMGKELKGTSSVVCTNEVRAPKPSNRVSETILGREGLNLSVSDMAGAHFVLLQFLGESY